MYIVEIRDGSIIKENFIISQIINNAWLNLNCFICIQPTNFLNHKVVWTSIIKVAIQFWKTLFYFNLHRSLNKKKYYFHFCFCSFDQGRLRYEKFDSIVLLYLIFKCNCANLLLFSFAFFFYLKLQNKLP